MPESKTGPRQPRPGPVVAVRPVSVAPHGAEAVRAVDRLAVGRAERDASVLAAVRADRIEHLARRAAAGAVAAAAAVPGVIATAARVRAAAAIATAVARARCLAARAARGAPAGLRVSLLGIEGLFALREFEFHPAVGTGQGLVGHVPISSVCRRLLPGSFELRMPSGGDQVS